MLMLHCIVVVGEQSLWVTDLSTVHNLNWQMHLVFGLCLLELVLRACLVRVTYNNGSTLDTPNTSLKENISPCHRHSVVQY
jgi:hypothetical protein